MQNESESKENISRFEKLLVELARADVDFCVVGGLAVILAGYVRVTEDADILISAASENIRRLVAVLSRWGQGWGRELAPQDFAPQEGSVRVSEEFDLDIFTQLQGRTLEDFRSRLRFFESDGLRIPFLSPADLIALKQGSWRDKDKLDVAALQEVLRRERGGGGDH